ARAVGHAGVVHQALHRTVLLAQPVGQRGPLLLAADVQVAVHAGPAFPRYEVAQMRGEFVACVVEDGGGDDVSAGQHEELRLRRALAACGAGDDEGLSDESGQHFSAPCFIGSCSRPWTPYSPRVPSSSAVKLPSPRMNAIRAVASPRFSQRWSVPRWTTTAPGPR